MARDGVWSNKDGLVVGYGTRTPTYSGSYANAEAATHERKIFLRIRGEDLADTVATTSDQLVNGVVIPNGAFIKSATFDVTEVFAGASATLDIGVYNGASGAAVDDDGIDAAIAVTSIDAVGDQITCDGDDVGTTVATSGGVKIAASYDTAAFTAGEGVLTVVYYYPLANS